ncbi:MAG TPA: two-component regulator propeller domain-containing protein [Prolixibacteraceae bacterium]|nr:two-component regulator propeller domain-containing protein [Prolixibacteraceae bacterium]
MKRLKTLKYRLTAILFLNLIFSLNALAVKFYSINSLFGISMRETNSVVKDDNGFVWASSKTGVLRLSKDNYHIYRLPYESSDFYKVKLIYKNFKLFAYTNNGQVFYYNQVFDKFELILNLNRIMLDMLIDDKGICWISTSLGLYEYQSGKLSPAFEFSSNTYVINWYDSKNIIVAKQDGIWLFNINSIEKRHIYENRNLSSVDFSSLYFDKDQDKLWLGTMSEGLFLYNFKNRTCSNQLRSVLPEQPILAIKENSDSTCLIGFDGQGIWELDRRNQKVLNIYKESLDVPFSLRGNGVYDLFCDKNNRVWVCTYSGGLSFFDQASPLINQIVHLPNNSNSLTNNDINSIIEDSWGKLWFATNNGICCWDVAANKWSSFYNDNETHAQVFLSLCEDNQGRIWAGTYSSGVYLLDGKTGKELAHYNKTGKDSPLLNDFIFNIYKDSSGDIWFGSVGGSVVCYLSGENRFRTYSSQFIGCFAELAENQILLGCSDGLKQLNKQTGNTTKLITGLLIRDVLVMGEDVWICTSGDGLVRYKYKTGETEKFTAQMGLPSNFINSIIYANDYLWLGTENGLCRFDPKNTNAVTYSSIYSLSATSFNSSSHSKLKNGQLALGTNNGVVIFAPDLVDGSSTKGRIFFQDLTVAGRSIRDIPSFNLKTPIDSLQEINLRYFQNTITLELLSLGQTPGSKFSWEMEGFDLQWSQPTENNVITYTNIPSGHFILRIRLFDSSLSDVLAERSIKINSTPPFWRTGWFWMLVFILMSGIIFLYLLYYINRLKQEHTEEKVRFFTNTAHDIRTSLTLIKAPVEELSKENNLTESGKYYLNLAIEQARQLTSVVTQLMDFQKVDIGKEHLLLSMTDIVKLISNRRIMLASFAKSKNIKLVFVPDCECYMTAVDESKMEKIIDNLITNAIKYSHNNSQIQIDLKCDDKKWMLQVKDNGIGISKRAQRQLFKEFYRGDNAINSKVVGSGIGLLLVKNYVAIHGGNISCSSQENVGSTFQVVIPFKSISGKSVATKASSDISITSSDIRYVSSQTESENEIQTSKEMKVLIVEDNDDLLNFMKATLSVEFKVFTAVDGEKAWEFISKQIPDLVVSDIMMPNMDGFELCKIMKSTYETSHIPLVLLTALSETTNQLHGLGLGADDYLTKPFDMNLLIQRIKSIIRNREVVREKALKLLKGNSNEPILTNEHNDKFVRKMLEVARVNIPNTEFDKEEFASAMNVSSSLLYKKIKSLTDQSPGDFIKTIRLNHAVELLQSGKYTVTEVSELCGFASLTYFGIVFRKQFGKSPSEILD